MAKKYNMTKKSDMKNFYKDITNKISNSAKKHLTDMVIDRLFNDNDRFDSRDVDRINISYTEDHSNSSIDIEIDKNDIANRLDDLVMTGEIILSDGYYFRSK